MARKNAGLRDLLSFAGPHRWTIAGALALGLVGALAALAQPLLVGDVLRAVRTGGSVARPAALLVALFALDAVFTGLQGYLMGRTGEGVVLGLRRALVGRLLRTTVAEHDRRRTGDLLSRVGTDTTLLKAALAQSLTNIVVGSVVFVGAIALMALIDPLLLAVALACVAVAAALMVFVAARVRAATEEAQASVGSLGAALERALRAFRTVKIGRAEAREEANVADEAGAAYKAGVRAAAYEALIGPATNVALQGSFVLVLGVGGARLAAGDLALEDLVAFLLYLLYLVGPLAIVFSSFTELQQGLAAMGRIKEVLRSPVETGPRESKHHPAAAPDPVARLDRVVFGYGPDRPVLEDVSFGIHGPGSPRWSGPRGPASPPSSPCSRASTTRTPEPWRWKAGTSETFRWPTSAGGWPTWSRTRRSSPAPCARTSSTPTRTRRKTTSKTSSTSQTFARSSGGYRAASIRRSGTAGRCSPAGSARG